MAKGKETAVQRAIIEALQTLGCLVFRLNSGAIDGTDLRGQRMHVELCPPGTPDVMAVLLDGRVVWVECKYKKGRLSPAQVAMHRDLRQRGHLVIVARSVDDLLEALGFKPPFVLPAPGLWNEPGDRDLSQLPAY